jgi:radical SAM-linked protein
LVLLKFKVGGNMRFLSHAETVRVFQRACIRAGIKLQYTQGFNPHPKLSLPLPRSVGVESDDELLCIRINLCPSADNQSKASESPLDAEEFKAALSGHLPDGFQMLSAAVAEGKASFQPCSATYILEVKPEYFDDKLKTAISHLLASESVTVQRLDAGKSKMARSSSPLSHGQACPERSRRNGRATSKIKSVDVRSFIKSIAVKNGYIVIECAITPAGTIRVDEILQLMGLDAQKLAASIKRSNVQWQEN